MAQLDEIVGKSNIQGVIEMDKALISLDETFMRVLKSSKETASVLNSSTASYVNLKKAEEETVKQTEKLSAAEKEAEKIAKEQAATLAALDKQRQAAYKKQFEAEQKAIEIENKRIAKEKELAAAIAMEVKSIKDAEVQNKALREIKSRLNLTTEEGRKKNEQYNQTINKNTEFIRKNSDAAKQQQMNIGNYKSALEGLPGPLGRISSAATTAGRALMSVVANPVIAGIVALAGALMLLVESFKSVDDGADKVELVTNRLRAQWDILKVRIGDVISGNRTLGETFRNLRGDIDAAGIAAITYTALMDRLNDVETLHISETADVQLQIAKLSVIYKDATKTAEERRDALRQMLDLEKELADFQTTQASDAYESLLIKVAMMNESLGISKEELTNFIKMNHDAAMELVDNDPKWSSFWNQNQDNIKALEESYALVVTAQTEYFNQSKKAFGQMTTFEKEIIAEKNAAIKAEKERAEKGKANYESLTQAVQDYARAVDDIPEPDVPSDFTPPSPEDDPFFKRLENIKAFSQAAYADTEKGINESYARQLASLDEMHNLGLIKEEEYQAAIQKLNEDTENKKREELFKSVDALSEAGQVAYDISNAFATDRMNDIQRQYEFETQLAGDNEQAKTKADQKYQAARKEEQKKQAKADKTMAVFNAAIYFAQALIAALTVPPPASFVFEAITAVLAGIQLAAVIATPIPQFFKGTESAPDGLISVGEKGREIIQTRSGKVLMANDHTILSGMKGAKIYSNEETEAILKAGRGGYDSRELKTTLERNNERLIRTIQNKREVYLDFSTRKVSEREGGHWTHYKNRYFR